MGLTAVDTGVLIGFLDADDPYHRSSRTTLIEATSDGAVLLPGIAYTETLIAVLRAGADQAWFETMLRRLGIAIGSCGPEALAGAAALRASALNDRRRRQWKLPDALIVAESQTSGSERLITTDANWPEVESGMEVLVLRPSG
jgi:predicted nucleic acid-binding protein